MSDPQLPELRAQRADALAVVLVGAVALFDLALLAIAVAVSL